MTPTAASGAAARRCGGVVAMALAFALVTAATGAHAQSADLVVNQADSPDPGPAGGVFTYTVRVDNNGPDAALAVVVDDSLPPGATLVGATTTQGSCVAAAGTVSCALGDLAFLDSATVTVQVRLPSAGVWTNTASASSSTPDPDAVNNAGLAENTTAQVAADLSLTAGDAPDPVAAGQNLSYALTARNNGPNALGATDTQTIAFTIAANTCLRAVPSGVGWSCTPSTGYPRCSGTVTCTRTGALAVNANAPVLTVPAVANLGGAVTAAFAVSSSLPDGNAANDTATATTTVSGGSSNVSISKTASPATVAVGSNVTYTITPRHNGGEPPGTLAPNLVTVTDTLNPALAFVSASGTGWSCAFSAPTLTCTRPGPYSGGTFTNMPAITLVAQVLATGTIPNTATVSAPESDPVPGNNSASINITGSTTSDLRLTKSATATLVAPNTTFNYTLTVRNLGPAAVPASNTITVTDTLPAGLTLMAQPGGAGWSCAPAAGFPLAGPAAITCSRPGPLAVNGNAPNITVQARAAVSGTTTNNACVVLSGTGTNDPTPANDCAAVAVTATATQADVQVVSKTASPIPVLAGHDLTYVVTVRNNSADDATNVTVMDTLASLVAVDGFQSAVPSQGSCTPSTVTAGPSVVLSCNLGTLGGGATATVTIVVRPTRATTGGRGNTASVTSDVGDPVPGNNAREVSSTVTAVADVAVSKTATPSPVQAGTPLTYVVTARNNGPSAASNVTIDDPLPAGTTFGGLVSVTGGGSCAVPAAGAAAGSVSCTWASIAAATQQAVTFTVLPQTALVGGSVDNAVTSATTTIDETPANDTFSLSTPVTGALVDVLVNKVDTLDPVALGQTTMYTVTVTNSGPSQASNVVLTDAFPSGVPTATFSYQGALTVTPAGAGSCIEPALSATSGTLTCTFASLAAGQSAAVSYSMRAESIAAGVTGTTFNDATVVAAETEIQPANNQTVHATTARSVADMALVKSAPATLTPGAPFTWTLTVTNHGPNDSTGAVVTDVLPAGVAFLSASAGCSFAAGTVTCTLPALTAGASTAHSITVLPASPYTGANPLVNSATLATPSEVDPMPGNNASTATTAVGSAQADLSIAKSGPATVLPGGSVQWQLVVANAGPSVANGATFSDTLPPGVTAVTASCGSAVGGASCGPVIVGAGTVSGSAATLPVGGAITITITATAPAAGTLVNSAGVIAPPGAVDPQAGNDIAATTTAVTQLPDLVIAKSATGPFMQGQTGAGYALVVSNIGAGPTTASVSVTDVLPADLAATAIAGAGWTCTLVPLGCTRSDALAAGASYPPITLTVSVAAGAAATVVNTATVGGGGEANTANNSASVATPVAALPADLAIVKVANGVFTRGQIGATYTLSVANIGASSTTGVVTVADTPPPYLMPRSIGGAGWSCSLATLACARGDALEPGGSYPPVTLVVDVAANAPQSIVNGASVASAGDPNPANDATTVTTLAQPAQASVHPIPGPTRRALALLALAMAFAALLEARAPKRRRSRGR